jgi:hypothetical protein
MELDVPHQIKLKFNSFAVHPSDELQVYSSSMPMTSKDDGTLILTRTGQCATSQTSACPKDDGHAFVAKSFLIVFISDLTGTDKGFNLTYHIQPVGQ